MAEEYAYLKNLKAKKVGGISTSFKAYGSDFKAESLMR